MGLFGGKSVTGLSSQKVNDAIDQFNNDSEKVLEELNLKLNEVLKKIAENWGTADAVKHVSENVLPSFSKLEERIADIVEGIGKTIKNTAEKQAEDSKNTISVNAVKRAAAGVLVNTTKEELDNGYIGVYTSLQQEVKEANESLITDLLNRLTVLKNNAVDKCSSAFTDEGTSIVAQACDMEIERIKSEIDQAFKKVNESMDELTSKATTFAKEIQNAGLRGVAGSDSGTTR